MMLFTSALLSVESCLAFCLTKCTPCYISHAGTRPDGLGHYCRKLVHVLPAPVRRPFSCGRLRTVRTDSVAGRAIGTHEHFSTKVGSLRGRGSASWYDGPSRERAPHRQPKQRGSGWISNGKRAPEPEDTQQAPVSHKPSDGSGLGAFLARVREDRRASKHLSQPPPGPNRSAGDKPPPTAAEVLLNGVSPLRKDALHPLGSLQLQAGPPRPRFDPKLLPDVIRVFQRASSRLGFTTQLPHAVAVYVAAAAQHGTLDLASYDVSVCKALVLYMGQAQVVHRDCLDELRKALQPRWSQLAPDDLVELLAGLQRINDVERCAAVGRRTRGTSRLLRMLVDADPAVLELLGASKDAPQPKLGKDRQQRQQQQQSAGGVAAAGAAAAAGSSARNGATSAQSTASSTSNTSSDGGGGSGSGSSSHALTSGTALQLARAYLSFYLTATLGNRMHYGMSPMLQRTLLRCLARVAVDPAVAAGGQQQPPQPPQQQRVPADELARLVAGLAQVAGLPTHPLSGELGRLAKAVMERSSELSPMPRALLLGLRPDHWAFPEGWQAKLEMEGQWLQE